MGKAKSIVCAGLTYPTNKTLADAYGINPKTLWRRLKNGWSAEQAVKIEHRADKRMRKSCYKVTAETGVHAQCPLDDWIDLTYADVTLIYYALHYMMDNSQEINPSQYMRMTDIVESIEIALPEIPLLRDVEVYD